MMTMVLGMDDDGEWNAARIFFSPQSLCLVYGEQHLSLSERVQHYLLWTMDEEWALDEDGGNTENRPLAYVW